MVLLYLPVVQGAGGLEALLYSWRMIGQMNVNVYSREKGKE